MHRREKDVGVEGKRTTRTSHSLRAPVERKQGATKPTAAYLAHPHPAQREYRRASSEKLARQGTNDGCLIECAARREVRGIRLSSKREVAGGRFTWGRGVGVGIAAAHRCRGQGAARVHEGCPYRAEGPKKKQANALPPRDTTRALTARRSLRYQNSRLPRTKSRFAPPSTITQPKSSAALL